MEAQNINLGYRNQEDLEVERLTLLLAEAQKHRKETRPQASNGRQGMLERSLVEPLSMELNKMIDNMAKPKQSTKIKERKKSKGPFRASKRLGRDTYLTEAFCELRSKDSSDMGSESKGSLSPSSSESDNSNRSSSSTEESSEEERRRKRKDKSQKKKKELRGTYGQLKPTPPEKYDGNADAVKYYQFVTQSMAYLKKGRVPKSNQIQEVANFLKGKAYRFYLNEVSMEMGEWNLQTFFKGVFNVCFPSNFRLLQQKKLDELRQGSMTVREYSAELKILY
ncbi:hypothetical protein C0992_001170 [Termitomyces sp. T32_za158]|nr:hypothetical protein C0992_001170 [Termitomyces sp. T32_za158]